MTSVTYNPAVFNVADIEAARRIIMTPQGGQDADERWVRETPYLTGLALEWLGLTERSLVVDFGCGVGRMAAAMIEATGCAVLGVDISPDMRRLAAESLPTHRFSAVSLSVFSEMVGRGLRADALACFWVLQHCPGVEPIADLLARALRPDGRALVVNNLTKAVPTAEMGWVDDGEDVAAIMATRLKLDAKGALDPRVVGTDVSKKTFWAAYRRG